jgi:hypothetical protein
VREKQPWRLFRSEMLVRLVKSYYRIGWTDKADALTQVRFQALPSKQDLPLQSPAVKTGPAASKPCRRALARVGGFEGQRSGLQSVLDDTLGAVEDAELIALRWGSAVGSVPLVKYITRTDHSEALIVRGAGSRNSGAGLYLVNLV